MREGRGVDAHVDLPLSVAGFRLSLKSLDVVGILRATSVLISTMATGAPIRNWGIPPQNVTMAVTIRCVSVRFYAP